MRWYFRPCPTLRPAHMNSEDQWKVSYQIRTKIYTDGILRNLSLLKSDRRKAPNSVPNTHQSGCWKKSLLCWEHSEDSAKYTGRSCNCCSALPLAKGDRFHWHLLRYMPSVPRVHWQTDWFAGFECLLYWQVLRCCPFWRKPQQIQPKPFHPD